MNDVASFCALVLRRLQDMGVPGELERDETYIRICDLNKIFGEALQQFSKEDTDATEG